MSLIFKRQKNQETVCSTFGSEKLWAMSKIHPFWKYGSSVVENNTIRHISFFVSFSIRFLLLMPFRKWQVVFQRRRSLIHSICPFLSLFCSFFILKISRACNTPFQSCYLNTEQCGHCPHFIRTHKLRFIGSENSQDGKGLWLGNSPLHTNRPNTIFEVKY